MSNSQNTYLTESQFTTSIISSMIGIGLLYLPNGAIKAAQQDGWMGCIFGAVYPLYIILIASFLSKKHPRENILLLSKRYLGNFLGNILNLIFVSFFIFIITSEAAGFSNVFRVYATSFLKSYQVLLPTLLVISYAAYKGIKPLGRLNELVFYLTIVLVFIPIITLKYGSILNLMPVFGSGIKSIVKASTETVFSYTGIEFIFLIYPFLQDSKKVLKCGIVGITIPVTIYTWITLLTIFYLGTETSLKYLWPVITLSDSVNIPIINSFRYIFIVLWSLIIFKCMSTFYFSFIYGLNQLFNKIPAEKFAVLMYPLIAYLSLLYGNPTRRRAITDKLLHYYLIFNLSYFTIIAIMTLFRKGDCHEKI